MSGRRVTVILNDELARRVDAVLDESPWVFSTTGRRKPRTMTEILSSAAMKGLSSDNHTVGLSDDPTVIQLRDWRGWAEPYVREAPGLPVVETDEWMRAELSKRLSEGLKAYSSGSLETASSDLEAWERWAAGLVGDLTLAMPTDSIRASIKDMFEDDQAWTRWAFRQLGVDTSDWGPDRPWSKEDRVKLRDDISRVWDTLTVDASKWKAKAIRAETTESGLYMSADQDWGIWVNTLLGPPEVVPGGDIDSKREAAQRRVEAKVWEVANWTSWAKGVLGKAMNDAVSDADLRTYLDAELFRVSAEADEWVRWANGVVGDEASGKDLRSYISLRIGEFEKWYAFGVKHGGEGGMQDDVRAELSVRLSAYEAMGSKLCEASVPDWLTPERAVESLLILLNGKESNYATLKQKVTARHPEWFEDT